MDDRQYMGKLHREAKAPKVVFVVFDDGGYEEGEVIAASSNKAIADSIATIGHWEVKEIPLVEDIAETQSVVVYQSSGARMSTGLWSINHRSDTMWRRRVTCGEADITHADPGGPRTNPIVFVVGTDEMKVRETFQAEALKIEAEYGHDKLRTQVEELDPIERF
jgi:hypothetical protein